MPRISTDQSVITDRDDKIFRSLPVSPLKAYVACGLGISEIGFVMTSFGIADAICRFFWSPLHHRPGSLCLPFLPSLVFGPLIKLFGRMPLLMFGAVINLLMIITLMVPILTIGRSSLPLSDQIWVVNPGDRTLFNAVAGVWGMADGVWNTQLNGEVGRNNRIGWSGDWF